MTTPQTRDDGLTDVLEIVRMLPDRYILVERAKWDALQSSLLSHKQQGRNEGLEEAAQVVTEHYQELSVEHRLLLVARANAILALISPLPKAGDGQ